MRNGMERNGRNAHGDALGSVRRRRPPRRRPPISRMKTSDRRRRHSDSAKNVPPGVVAVAFAVATAAWTAGRRTSTTATAFQTPVIFPLLWMAKRLTRHNRIGSSPPSLLLMPPLSSSVKSLVGIKKDGRRKKNDEETEALVEWLDGMEGGKSSSSVRIDADVRGLRGLYTTRDVRSGEVLVEIPYESALLVGDSLSAPVFDDFSHVPGSDGWSDDELDDVYQGLNFLQYFTNSVDDAPYVNTLPQKPSGDEAGLTPDFWPTESIEDIEIPSYVNQILARKRMVEEVAKKNNVGEDDLRWATWMIRSRRFTTWNMVRDPNAEEETLFGAFPIRRRNVEQVQGFLLPLIDMANHAHNPNAVLKISVNRWTREFDDTSTFALRATRRIKRGEEVTISYGDGDLTCLDLLDKYGFFLDGNDADKTIDWEELRPEFATSLEEDEAELAMLEGSIPRTGEKRVLAKTKDRLKTIVSKMQDYTPNFPQKLGDNLVLVGAGMRKKMGIKIYAVAMYGTPALLDAASRSSSRNELWKAARSLDASSPRTTFVLEMILQADTADMIAVAIADSVKLRHGGSPSDVQCLERLIAEGVRRNGQGATKGAVLQFDCTNSGVSVGVGGETQGSAEFEGLGRAFVDVFMDESTVSPSLVDDCLERGNGEEGDGSAATSKNKAFRKDRESRRTVLSLHALMKRLSNWQPKSTALPNADDDVINAGELQQEEELIESEVSNNGKGSDFSETVINDTDGSKDEIPTSSPNDEIVLTALVDEDGNSPGPNSSEMSDRDTTPAPSSSDAIEITGSVDEDVKLPGPDLSKIDTDVSVGDAMPMSSPDGEIEASALGDEDVVLPGPDLLDSASDISVGDVAPDDEYASKSAPISETGKEATLPGDEITMDNFTKFNANEIQARIRQLEAEIETEMARVKSFSVGTQDNTIAVDPTPDSNSEDAAQEKARDGQVSFEKQAKLKLEDEERQRATEPDKTSAEPKKGFEAVESNMKSLKDKATGVSFEPKLGDDLFLVGVGVRKKSIISIYSVAMYSSLSTLEALSPFPRGKRKKEARAALRDAARTFGPSSPTTTFVLEMVFKADAQTIASAIAEGVKPRYGGSPSDVKDLEKFIVEGVDSKGGQATKGTIFRFDCIEEGVEVSVDGNQEGMVSFEGMGSALVDVFMDDKAVSPQLIDSCLDTWCESGL